jgi:acylphosphatase
MSEPTTAATIARAVNYSGRVQGVGFRATTAHLARSYAVSGWVRNLPDGRVELFVEGVEAEVLRFLEAVRSRWRGYIQDEVIETRQPTGRTGRFEIVG